MPADAAARQQQDFSRRKMAAEKSQPTAPQARRNAGSRRGQAAGGGHRAPQKEGVHAEAWAFGRGPHASHHGNRKGVSGNDLQRRAVLTHSAPPRRRKAEDEPIDAAGVKERAARGGMGVSWKDEGDAWRSDPDSKMRPDEGRLLENRHRVGAYAEVEDHDVRFKAGPELILKDEKSASHAINKDQPDSALGLGMQLELGF